MNDITDIVWDRLVAEFYSDLSDFDEFERVKPVLAHYTSIDVLEKILSSGEIWFSNPLFMNDLEEVRFGVIAGRNKVIESDKIRKALKSGERHQKFLEEFDHYISEFETKHLLDTYVFCLTQHDVDNHDGLLSMWRGYGGFGKGAALVFDTSAITPVDGSPFMIARVSYASTEERNKWFDWLVSTAARTIRQLEIADEHLYLISSALFERIKVAALFSKHHGFREENEWRVVYLSERDNGDRLKQYQTYLISSRGVEPKLKFKLGPTEGWTSGDLSLDNLLIKILLGPSVSSPLSLQSIRRMLEVIGRPELKDRVVASSIPLRATD